MAPKMINKITNVRKSPLDAAAPRSEMGRDQFQIAIRAVRQKVNAATYCTCIFGITRSATNSRMGDAARK
jgi:hypothetical protein